LVFVVLKGTLTPTVAVEDRPVPARPKPALPTPVEPALPVPFIPLTVGGWTLATVGGVLPWSTLTTILAYWSGSLRRPTASSGICADWCEPAGGCPTWPRTASMF